MTDISRESVENVCRGLVLVGGEQVLPFVEITMALRTALDAADGRVTVKPLVWVKHPSADIWRVGTMIGTYKVFAVNGESSWDLDWLSGPYEHSSTRVGNADDGKAAAQAHYTAAILSAIIGNATPHLQAAAMRAKAADHCRKVSEDCKKYNLPQAAGMVASVGREILALPLEADHKALLREAAKLPEIAALIALLPAVLESAMSDSLDCQGEFGGAGLDELYIANQTRIEAAKQALSALDTP